MHREYLPFLLLLSLLFIFSSCSDSATTESTEIHQLNVSAEPSEAGTVTPTGGQFDDGETVEISASANQNWIFEKWQGGHTGTANPASITMNSDKQITALFLKVEYALNKEVRGEGSIFERVLPAKTTTHQPGTIVEVLATPDEGWMFSQWETDLTGTTNPTKLTMDSEKTVTAVFERKNYELTIEIEGEGAVAEENIQAKTSDYPFETIVQLTANPATGWQFDRWEGDLTGSSNPAQIEITNSTAVKAVFVRQTFSITTQVEGEGTVSRELISGTENESGYEYESQVELTATPSLGWEFTGWQGDITSADNPVVVDVNTDKQVRAIFKTGEYSVNVIVDGSAEIVIDLIAGEKTDVGYVAGSEIQISVNPADGWNFVYWDGDVSSTNNPIQLTLNQNYTLTAVLDQSPFAGGNGTEQFPYQVSTIEQLQSVGEFNYLDNFFVQTNNIDAVETAGWNNGLGFNPIGDSSIRFVGSYDGNGFSISNLYINRPEESFVGLFGYVYKSSGQPQIKIKDLHLTNVNIIGNRDVGGMVGQSRNGTIINSTVQGKVVGVGNVGGIVGFELAEIINSSSETIVEGDFNVGGLVGFSNGSSINKSYTISSVSGIENVGGFVGHNWVGTVVKDSYSQSDVTGDIQVGGFAGKNETEIINSFSLSTVSGNTDVGSFIGLNTVVVNSTYWNSDISAISSSVGRGISEGITALNNNQMIGSAAQTNMPEFDWTNIWITTDSYPILRWQNE